MKKQFIIIAILIIVALAGITFLLLNINDKEIATEKKPVQPSQFSISCQTNSDCKKYPACEEVICANKDQVNEQMSTKKLSNCDIDFAYDPPGAFSLCECVNGTCGDPRSLK